MIKNSLYATSSVSLKEKVKRVTAIGITCVLIMNPAEGVYAQTAKELYGIPEGYGKSNTIVIDDCLNGTANKSAFTDAKQAWNESLSVYKNRYTIEQNSSKNYVTESDELAGTVYGCYRVLATNETKSWRKTTQFSILIHKDDFNTTRWDTKFGKRNWRRSTFSHELGHSMSLSDLDDGVHASGFGEKSIMSYNRDRKKLTTPQPLDRTYVVMFK